MAFICQEIKDYLLTYLRTYLLTYLLTYLRYNKLLSLQLTDNKWAYK